MCKSEREGGRKYCIFINILREGERGKRRCEKAANKRARESNLRTRVILITHTNKYNIPIHIYIYLFIYMCLSVCANFTSYIRNLRKQDKSFIKGHRKKVEKIEQLTV